MPNDVVSLLFFWLFVFISKAQEREAYAAPLLYLCICICLHFLIGKSFSESAHLY